MRTAAAGLSRRLGGTLSHRPLHPASIRRARRPLPGADAIQGERGLLLFPSDWLLRLRHKPFYGYLEARVLEWLDRADRRAASPDSGVDG